MSPRELEPTRAGGSATGLLNLCAALTCATAAWQAWIRPTPINSFLFLELGLDAQLVDAIDLGVSILLGLTAAAIIGLRSRIACALAALWLLLSALAQVVLGGEPFAFLAPLAHATRFGVPLALLAIYLGRERAAFGLLRWCVAATFATHGWEALQHTPAFIDLIILSARDQLDMPISESSARAFLTAIGWIDVGLALLVVGRRWRVVAGYMAVWGAITLASRVIALGAANWPETTIRTANAVAPLALLLHWRALARGSED
jgi:hypothetical protein